MNKTPINERLLDRVILLFLFALFLLLSPLKNWWASDQSPWFAPYLLWGFILFLAFLLQRRMRSHDL